MTDRVKGFTVTLDKDIRIDDVQPLMDAIGCMKHVIDVSPVIAESTDEHIARVRISREVREKLYDLIKEL